MLFKNRKNASLAFNSGQMSLQKYLFLFCSLAYGEQTWTKNKPCCGHFTSLYQGTWLGGLWRSLHHPLTNVLNKRISFKKSCTNLFSSPEFSWHVMWTSVSWILYLMCFTYDWFSLTDGELLAGWMHVWFICVSLQGPSTMPHTHKLMQS